MGSEEGVEEEEKGAHGRHISGLLNPGDGKISAIEGTECPQKMGCAGESTSAGNTHTHTRAACTYSSSFSLLPSVAASFSLSSLGAPGQITIPPSWEHFSSTNHKENTHTHTHAHTRSCSSS